MSTAKPSTPAQAPPPANPSQLKPELHSPAVGSVWFRFVRAAHPLPLGVGNGASRFSDPEVRAGRFPRFRPLYLGASFGVCFLETVLRDAANGKPGDWPLTIAELRLWTCAVITVAAPISLVDLRGDAAVRVRVPSDALRAADHHSLGQAWAAAFWAHPEMPDGLAYHSRLNSEECLAIYTDEIRPASPRLVCLRRTSLLDMTKHLNEALDRFNIALLD